MAEARSVDTDGIHLQARVADEQRSTLVMIGPMPEGRKELVGITDDARKSAQDRRELLLDLKRRGLRVAPRLVIPIAHSGSGQPARQVSRSQQPSLLISMWIISPSFSRS